MTTRRNQGNLPLLGPLDNHSLTAIRNTNMASDNESNAGSQQPAASISLFAPISAPILRSLEPVNVSRFLKERERYLLEIEAKQVDVPSLKALPYKASVDRSLLKSAFFFGKFQTIAADVTEVSNLTSEHIESFVKSLVARTSATRTDYSVIEKVLVGFSMPMKIVDADVRIMHYFSDFFERLESVGYGSFRTENPEQTVKLLISRLQPAALKHEMRKQIQFDKTLEKDVQKFAQVLIIEAVNYQKYGVETKDPSKKDNPKGGTKKKPTDSETPKPKPPKPTKEAPLCLWEEHRKRGIKHYLRHCKECPKDVKDKLFEEQRAKRNDGAKRATDNSPPTCADGEVPKSVNFIATFGGHHRATICADTCSDDNICHHMR